MRRPLHLVLLVALVATSLAAAPAATDTAAPYTTSRPVTTPERPDLADEIVLFATFEDQASAIAGASYTVDGGPMRPMAAIDGAFDETREGVRADVGILAAGTHRLCVYAVDEHGNSSAENAARSMPIGDEVPRECVDVEVRDRLAPVITAIEQVPGPAAFGEQVVMHVTVDDRGRGDSDVRTARVTIDGEELAPVFGTSDTGPVATILVRLDGFTTPGTHEFCAKARDEAFNSSDWTCATIEITDRIAVGSLTTRSMARPESHLGPGATFTIDASQSPDGSVTGGFTYSEPGIEFAADLPDDAVFEGRDLDHALRATGTGLLHGLVTCDYELTVLDHAGQDDETDTLFLTVTCDGTTVVDGGEPAQGGDVEVRA